MNQLELFLTISGGVIYWQTPGLTGHKGLMDTIDRPFQYCLDLTDNRGTFAVFNHHIEGKHYVSVTCAMFGKDDRGRANAPYRFHAVLPWVIYQEQLGTDAFALARWAFSKEVLGRIYGNTKSEIEGELFSPQVYQNFPPQIEAKRQPDIIFMLKHWDEQQLKLFIGALIVGVAPPLRFRDNGNVAQWSPNQHWSDRKPTDGERLLEELYLCLPDETRAWCNISTAWNRCDQFPFHLALDSRSSENAQTALTRVVGSMTEEARYKAEVVVKQYVTPLFQAIADNNEKRINQLPRFFTIKSISWPSEQKMVDGESSVTDHNNRLLTMAKHPFVIGVMGISLVVGFGIGGGFGLFFSKLEETQTKLKETQTELKKTQAKLEKTQTELENTRIDFKKTREKIESDNNQLSQYLTKKEQENEDISSNLSKCNQENNKLEQENEGLTYENKYRWKQLTNLLPQVVINEIAWMGTTMSSNDEWIELHNFGNNPIDLENWKLVVIGSNGKSEKNILDGKIKGGGFLVLRNKNNNNRIFINLNSWDSKTFRGELWNQGRYPNQVSLFLKDVNDNTVDQVDQWYAGNFNGCRGSGGICSTVTMERKKPRISAPSMGTRNGRNDEDNWCNANKFYNGKDENSPYDKGTPGEKNSCAEEESNNNEK